MLYKLLFKVIHLKEQTLVQFNKRIRFPVCAQHYARDGESFSICMRNSSWHTPGGYTANMWIVKNYIPGVSGVGESVNGLPTREGIQHCALKWPLPPIDYKVFSHPLFLLMTSWWLDMFINQKLAYLQRISSLVDRKVPLWVRKNSLLGLLTSCAEKSLKQC